MKTMKISSVVVLLVLASSLLLSACSQFGVAFGNNRATVTVNLQEDQVNEMIENSTTDSDDDLLDDVTSIDMQDGLIRVFGTKDQVSGSYDVSMGQTDGDMWVKITDVDLPGVSLDDPRITKLNNKLDHDFTQMADENQDSLTFSKVEITKDAVQMVIEIDIKQ